MSCKVALTALHTMTTSLAQPVVVVGEFPKEDTIHNFP